MLSIFTAAPGGSSAVLMKLILIPDGLDTNKRTASEALTMLWMFFVVRTCRCLIVYPDEHHPVLLYIHQPSGGSIVVRGERWSPMKPQKDLQLA